MKSSRRALSIDMAVFGRMWKTSENKTWSRFTPKWVGVFQEKELFL